ncbi:MAG: hypothetical protein GKR94_07455 [Gammaproteobacteria bacterium]|nr:hypothetical protein [Gammaproteobacteria bacterium]
MGSREDSVTALEWTEFDADGQSTLMLSMVTRHGRSTPMVWRRVSSVFSTAIASYRLVIFGPA